MTEIGSAEDGTSDAGLRYGNFMNYYKFNPAENRLRLFPNFTKYLNTGHENIVCLDVGCNTGELTEELQKHVAKKVKPAGSQEDRVLNCHILAVDLDEGLIEQAKSISQNKQISYFCVDVLTNGFEDIYKNYLKQHSRKMFDVVFCFSVTMWVHINYGDEGLKRFIISLTEIGDLVVIEPQPWRCYGRAVRRLKRTNCEPFQEFKNLRVRKDVESYIDRILIEDCKFLRILQTAPTSWGRQINFYKKNYN